MELELVSTVTPSQRICCLSFPTGTEVTRGIPGRYSWWKNTEIQAWRSRVCPTTGIPGSFFVPCKGHSNRHLEMRDQTRRKVPVFPVGERAKG